MVVKVHIKRRAYGMTYAFTIKNIDLSTKTATLWLWKDGEHRIRGGTCTAAYDSPDTTVSYVVQDGDFPDVEDYDSEIRFSSDALGYREKSETFLWVVEESAPSTSTSTSTSTTTTSTSTSTTVPP